MGCQSGNVGASCWFHRLEAWYGPPHIDTMNRPIMKMLMMIASIVQALFADLSMIVNPFQMFVRPV